MTSRIQVEISSKSIDFTQIDRTLDMKELPSKATSCGFRMGSTVGKYVSFQGMLGRSSKLR